MARALLVSSLVLLSGLGFVACSDDDGVDPVETGTLVITLSENVKGAELVQKDIDANARYTNAAGNHYGVELFEYLLSEFELIPAPRPAKAMQKLGGAIYRNAFNPATNMITFDDVPAGSYGGIGFYWGVPEELNFRDPDGPDGLPTEIGELMAWPDNLGGGYHCNRLNLVWDNVDGADQGSAALHMGRLDKGDGEVTNCHTYLSFAEILFQVERGQETHLEISLDVDKLTNFPVIDFGTPIGTGTWLMSMPNHAAQSAMRDNMNDVFEVSVTP